MRTVFPYRLNNEFVLKFSEDYYDYLNKAEGVQQLKHCKYNSLDEDNSLRHVNSVNKVVENR